MLVLWSLVSYGLIVFYTSSFFLSLELTGDPNFLFLIRLKYLFLSFIVFFVFERISLDFLRKIVSLVLLITFALVLVTFLSPSISGAKRWIFLGGISIQPSEIFKLSFTIYLSSYLSKFRLKTDNNISYWIKPMLIFSGFWLLIILQNDYSTAIYFAILFFIVLFVSEMAVGYMFSILFTFLPISVLFLMFEPYRVARIFAFLNPYEDPSGKGYQIIASLNALKSGGIWGKGLGMGEVKLGKLPEANSDFIFSVLGEELGFLGVCIAIVLFFLFFYLGYFVAIYARDRFKFFIAFISSLVIFLQSIMNILIAVGLLPPTGINLPFFSSGGSSIVVTMALAGLIANVARDVEGG
ncbi:putative lipid II flippase FtsW [Borrelia sp. BU AG58]|uniref:putative lipid II flippase FtsW n=1 Tax=Borrelia sp. BU AG58 TaxID=2887345 RepID=UPI001E5CE518|nr:putative lipid II flippase FtsW [Borrelia sp. BU AG58]UER68015.1 putative lipid II flippase FtsW [Borrelia sp. BU AG58]